MVLQHRRVHIHVPNEVFNIHEHLMVSMCKNWAGGCEGLIDEKAERHFRDDMPLWIWRTISSGYTKTSFPATTSSKNGWTRSRMTGISALKRGRRTRWIAVSQSVST